MPDQDLGGYSMAGLVSPQTLVQMPNNLVARQDINLSLAGSAFSDPNPTAFLELTFNAGDTPYSILVITTLAINFSVLPFVRISPSDAWAPLYEQYYGGPVVQGSVVLRMPAAQGKWRVVNRDGIGNARSFRLVLYSRSLDLMGFFNYPNSTVTWP